MIFAMAGHIASSVIEALVIKSQDTTAGRRYNAQVEIDQVAVIRAVSLCTADTVRVMTGIARCLFIVDVKMVPFERYVTGN
jgi:hypothetical protein